MNYIVKRESVAKFVCNYTARGFTKLVNSKSYDSLLINFVYSVIPIHPFICGGRIFEFGYKSVVNQIWVVKMHNRVFCPIDNG